MAFDFDIEKELRRAKTSKDLNDLRVEAVAEAEKLEAVLAKQDDVPTEAQQAEWDYLVDENGLIDRIQTKLQAQQKVDAEKKKLALHRSFGGGNVLGSNDGSGNTMTAKPQGPVFRCMQTGQLIHAVASDKPVAQKRELGFGQYDHDQPASIGAVLASILTGRNDFASPGQIQAAITGNDSGGGYLVNPELSLQFIDLARSASECMGLGVWTIGMESNEMHIARLTGDPTGHWRAEGVEVAASDVTFDRVTLRPKTLSAVVPISIELLEDAANAATIIEQAIQSALGLELDRAIMFGTGAESKPKGISHFENVNTLTGTGTPTNYSNVTKAISEIYKANFAGEPSDLGWIMHPRDAETFDGLTDSTGQPLQPTPWASRVQRRTTTSLPTNEGAGSNESFSILGDFSQCVVGMRTTGVNIRILDSGQVTDSEGNVHNAASQLKKLIVAYLRADVALLRPQWFTTIEGITAA